MKWLRRFVRFITCRDELEAIHRELHELNGTAERIMILIQSQIRKPIDRLGPLQPVGRESRERGA